MNKYKLALILLSCLVSVGMVWGATCTQSCTAGSCTTPVLTENASGKTIIQGEVYYGYTVSIGLLGIGCGPGSSCTWGGGACPLRLMQNTSTGDSVILVNDPDRGVKCGNSTGCTIDSWQAKTGGIKYTLLIKGSAVKDTTTFWRGCTTGTCVSPYDSTSDSWTTSIGTPTVTLSNPANNTVVDSETVTFMANWTGPMDCDNLSLWFNLTNNYSTTLPLHGNLSKNVDFDNYFNASWNASCCYSHMCSKGSSGNFTFTRMPKFNVTLTLPENNSNRSTFDWTLFVANQTNDMLTIPDNYSIYVNGSYLNSENLTHNLSLNLSYLWYGNSTWDTYVCWKHWCRWSINGNNTFIRNYIPSAIPTVTSPIIWSLTGDNLTTRNLSVNFTTTNAETNTTDWRLNNQSIGWWYTFNLPNTTGWTKDYSTHGQNMNVSTNPPRYTNAGCVLGGCYVYNATSAGTNSNYTQVEYLGLHEMADWTVMFWAKPQFKSAYGAGTAYSTIYSSVLEGGDVDNGPAFKIRFQNNNLLYITYKDVNETMTTSNTNGDYHWTRGTWHLITATYNNDTTTLKVYINGTEVYSNNYIYWIMPSSQNGTFIGVDYLYFTISGTPYESYQNGFNGTIDEFKIINKTLSQGQINAIYEEELANKSWTTITNDTTSCDDLWSVAVTPTDLIQDGQTKYSEELYIPLSEDCFATPRLKEMINDDIILWTKTGLNRTTENVTANYTLEEAFANATDWRIDNVSIMHTYTFDLPNSSGWVKDYSSYEMNLNTSGYPPLYKTTGCVKGGCYDFNSSYWPAIGSVLRINTSDNISQWDGFGISMWIKPKPYAPEGDQGLTMDFWRLDYFIGCYFEEGMQWCDGSTVAFMDWRLGHTPRVYFADNMDLPFNFTSDSWQMVTLSYSNISGDIVVYVNATPVASLANGHDVITAGNWYNITIGGMWRFNYDYVENGYNGSMDELRIFRRGLNGEQVRQLWEDTKDNKTTDILLNDTSVCSDLVSIAVTPGNLWVDGLTYYSLPMLMTCPAASINVTLFQPANRTITARKIIYFNATWQGTQPDNLSLNISNITYYTVPGNQNISVNLTLNSTLFENVIKRNLTWTAVSCDDHVCTDAWNGPWWLVQLNGALMLMGAGS